jgi:hypothetical protein
MIESASEHVQGSITYRKANTEGVKLVAPDAGSFGVCKVRCNCCSIRWFFFRI